MSAPVVVAIVACVVAVAALLFAYFQPRVLRRNVYRLLVERNTIARMLEQIEGKLEGKKARLSPSQQVEQAKVAMRNLRLFARI